MYGAANFSNLGPMVSAPVALVMSIFFRYLLECCRGCKLNVHGFRRQETEYQKSCFLFIKFLLFFSTINFSVQYITQLAVPNHIIKQFIQFL